MIKRLDFDMDFKIWNLKILNKNPYPLVCVRRKFHISGPYVAKIDCTKDLSAASLEIQNSFVENNKTVKVFKRNFILLNLKPDCVMESGFDLGFAVPADESEIKFKDKMEFGCDKSHQIKLIDATSLPGKSNLMVKFDFVQNPFSCIVQKHVVEIDDSGCSLKFPQKHAVSFCQKTALRKFYFINVHRAYGHITT